ncbi:hypothetical protein EYF80_021048 [Liparis tanakae]|uniref:Uncharacterized protein n=1 Tax=Liparis tanakae TaxID=230148 RepID=A0A4Z2HSB5_9TELE|nr:hypothetical protein EYF80_021048 [Liparis tanakae]
MNICFSRCLTSRAINQQTRFLASSSRPPFLTRIVSVAYLRKVFGKGGLRTEPTSSNGSIYKSNSCVNREFSASYQERHRLCGLILTVLYK